MKQISKYIKVVNGTLLAGGFAAYSLHQPF